MALEHGLKEGLKSRQLGPEYSIKIQMPEEIGESLNGQIPENTSSNPLNAHISRRRFLKLLGIGAGIVTLSHPLTKGLEAAAIKVEKAAKEVKAFTTREVLAKLIPEDPKSILLNARDVNLITDTSGNITGFDVLANQFGAAGRTTNFRTFTSSESNGVFSEFNKRNGEYAKESSVFYRFNGKIFIAIDSGTQTTTSGVMIVDETTGESKLTSLPPAYMPSKAVFPESAILALGRYAEVALVNMQTNEVKVLPVKLDHIEQGAVIGARIQRISDNSIMVNAGSTRGSYGIAEIKFNFSDLSLNGQPEWHYKDRRVEYYYAYVGAGGKVEEVYLYDRDSDELFIADHTTKQKKDIYKIPSLYSIKVDAKEVVAIVGVTGDRARKVWPRGVNPELNPEKVTTVNILEGFDDGSASSGVYEGIPPEGYINGEFFDFVLTAAKGPVAVKRQPNTDGKFDKYMLVKGILESYQQATATPAPQSTATPTSTVDKIIKVYLPSVLRAAARIGW